MKIEVAVHNGTKIAVIHSDHILISDVQSALDLMATVRYECDSDSVVLYKSALADDFFKLETKLAGEVLQKFINYQFRIAIVGDFSIYNSKSLKDFIYESNKGRNVFFVSTLEEALNRLGNR
jgi:hypothetical protein